MPNVIDVEVNVKGVEVNIKDVVVNVKVEKLKFELPKIRLYLKNVKLDVTLDETKFSAICTAIVLGLQSFSDSSESYR